MLDLLSIMVFIYLAGNNSLVTINATLYTPALLMNITLPVQPLGPVTVVNSTGQSIPYYISNNEVYLSMVNPGNVTIIYTPYINVLNNGTLQIRISTDYETQVYMASNVLPTTIPSNIQGFQETSNGIVLALAPGNYVINFITTGPVITTTTQHAMKTNMAQSALYSSLGYIIVIIMIALILSVLLIMRHRK
ncbi:hypothetical protein VMUT_2207 [Vulcanisaeta moutnovskia 768-28]|uniref:Uncharacterized protein n=1 Tax=Vulcanisaeta moutnovskia (strain 768-28) TaxID=985053 RepID=F0QXI8_VULM7|nr:hypothetical protein [Vulcanisaeta moutnovskia]ADY02403.1 hypothetical protein VMUT_2207 [Vulcanisaeta moutnovskia 768-28]